MSTCCIFLWNLGVVKTNVSGSFEAKQVVSQNVQLSKQNDISLFWTVAAIFQAGVCCCYHITAFYLSVPLSTLVHISPLLIRLLLLLPVNANLQFWFGEKQPRCSFSRFLWQHPSYPRAPICEALSLRAQKKKRGHFVALGQLFPPPGRLQQYCSMGLSVCCLYNPGHHPLFRLQDTYPSPTTSGWLIAFLSSNNNMLCPQECSAQRNCAVGMTTGGTVYLSIHASAE